VVRRPWSDLNGNLRLDPGEFTFAGFAGVFPTFDSDADRPFSDEFNVGVDHTLRQNLAISISYHRRHHRNGLAIIDRARPASAYSPIIRPYVDAVTGPQTITIYSLDPTLVNVRDRIITNVDILESDYNGMQLHVTKRMSSRWQLLGGLTLQKHEGFVHSGTFTNPGTQTDLNNPNYRLNRDNAAVFTDVPWIVTFSGSYQLPYDVLFSAKYGLSDGAPLDREMSVSGLAQTEPAGAIRVARRGDDRSDVVNRFVDVRFRKSFSVNGYRIEGTLDVFNLLNANHVLLLNERIGTSSAAGFTRSDAYAVPTRILTPRIVRFGVRIGF
ncbi:MAG: hypothetical protein ACRD1T_14675, partial [Acidimicrobiia bacterium]